MSLLTFKLVSISFKAVLTPFVPLRPALSPNYLSDLVWTLFFSFLLFKSFHLHCHLSPRPFLNSTPSSPHHIISLLISNFPKGLGCYLLTYRLSVTTQVTAMDYILWNHSYQIQSVYVSFHSLKTTSQSLTMLFKKISPSVWLQAPHPSYLLSHRFTFFTDYSFFPFTECLILKILCGCLSFCNFLQNNELWSHAHGMTFKDE